MKLNKFSRSSILKHLYCERWRSTVGRRALIDIVSDRNLTNTWQQVPSLSSIIPTIIYHIAGNFRGGEMFTLFAVNVVPRIQRRLDADI